MKFSILSLMVSFCENPEKKLKNNGQQKFCRPRQTLE